MAKPGEQDKDVAAEHANEAHREKRIDRNLSAAIEDCGIMARLIKEVDCNQKSMPEARRELHAWFNSFGPGKDGMRSEAKARMRRLKQISEAMFEELSTITSQP